MDALWYKAPLKQNPKPHMFRHMHQGALGNDPLPGLIHGEHGGLTR